MRVIALIHLGRRWGKGPACVTNKTKGLHIFGAGHCQINGTHGTFFWTWDMAKNVCVLHGVNRGLLLASPRKEVRKEDTSMKRVARRRRTLPEAYAAYVFKSQQRELKVRGPKYAGHLFGIRQHMRVCVLHTRMHVYLSVMPTSL